MTPAPEPEPEIAFQPLGLRPERVRARGGVVAQGRLVQLLPPESGGASDSGEKEGDRVPSCLTFGSASGRAASQEAEEGDEEGYGEEGRSLTPVFKRMHAQELESGSWGRGHVQPPPSVFSLSLGVSQSGSLGRSSERSEGRLSGQSVFSLGLDGDEFVEGERGFVVEEEDEGRSSPMPDDQRTRRRILGMSGTMGGSDVSVYQPDEPLDVEDEDSDVPGELREILKVHEEELRHERSMEEIPVFRASLTDHSVYPAKTTNHVNVAPNFPSPLRSSTNSLSLPSPSPSSTEDDTKKSFDFTGELRKLNESGASDRRSFVEQLENAFRTPARVDLRYGFEVPPPPLPPPLPDMPLGMKLGGAFEFSGASEGGEDGEEAFDDDVSRIVDVQLPSWSSATEVSNPTEAQADTNIDIDSVQLKTLGHSKSRSRLVDIQEPSGLLSLSASTSSSSSSRPSDGELDRSFRFGGLPKSEAHQEKEEKDKEEERELTLSDIIPPLAHARSISLANSLPPSVSRHGQHQTTVSDPSADLDSEALEDDSVLKSIYAKILEGLPPAVPRPKRVDPGVANSGVAKVCLRGLSMRLKANSIQ